jgi:hypothetical protein
VQEIEVLYQCGLKKHQQAIIDDIFPGKGNEVGIAVVVM